MVDGFDTTTPSELTSTGLPDSDPKFSDVINALQQKLAERHASKNEEKQEPEENLAARLSGYKDYIVPYAINQDGDGYRIEKSGVWFHHTDSKDKLHDEKIANHPFVPIRRMMDDKGGYQYTLAWLTADGKIQEVTAQASVLGNHNKVSSIFPDITITSGHARDCSEYVAECIGANQEWFVENVRNVATALGWGVEGTEVFTSGPDRPLPVEDTKNTGSWLSGFKPRGDLKEWTEAVVSAADRPLIQTMVTAAFAAPLLRKIGLPNFVVDLSGSTSGGKTVSLGLAASVWGDPHDTMVSWKNTRTALEHHLSMLRGVPLFVDESQLARVEDVEDLVYSLTGGKSKGRSRQDGSGLMDASVWETVMVMTGEQPVTSMTKKGGIVPRVVSMSGQPCEDKAQADQLTKAARDHHGLAGEYYIAYLQELDADVLKGRYEALRDGLGQEAMSQVGGRRADSVAVLALANRLAADAGLMPLLADDVWQWLVNGGGALTDNEEDRPRAALQAVLGWAALNTHKFFGHRDATTPPPAGWAGKWDLDKNRRLTISPAVVRELLEKGGYDAQRILLDWRDRGWLQQKGTQTSFPIKLNGNTVKQTVIVFLADLVAKVDPADQEEEEEGFPSPEFGWARKLR